MGPFKLHSILPAFSLEEDHWLISLKIGALSGDDLSQSPPANVALDSCIWSVFTEKEFYLQFTFN